MKMIKLKIDGIDVSVPEGSTILQAAKTVNVEIPSLCYLRDVNVLGDCRICVVGIKGRKDLVASCVTPVTEGMEVFTNTAAIRTSRKTTLELILSSHKKKCLSCSRSNYCELQRLSQEYEVDEDRYADDEITYDIDDESPYLVRDNNKCILCRRCVSACSKIQTVSAIGLIQRGYKVHIGCAFESGLSESNCVGCGQCIVVCPVGALSVKSNVSEVWDALANPSKKVVFYTAPSIRVTLGEAFDMPIGTNAEGQMVTAIRRLGADKVFNMDVAADLTIMEESNELVDRIQNNGALPLFTSCCPGWIKFVEHNYHEFIPNLSSCKSPQQMFGAVLKTYYCQKYNIDPEDLFVVSVIPCTAKKFEIHREANLTFGMQDVDVALTTTELAKMIKSAGLKFDELEKSEFDGPFDKASGAGAIFGAAGGVMEAALRTAGNILGGKDFKKIDFTEVRGMNGVKEATYKIAGMEIKVAAVNGLGNARELMDAIKNGEKSYHMIEVMACPGGCINGGGQPCQPDTVRNYIHVKTIRSQALYEVDKNDKVRKSHNDPMMNVMYDEYFDAPGRSRTHKILHTKYEKRAKF